jgi:hypothetical protein
MGRPIRMVVLGFLLCAVTAAACQSPAPTASPSPTPQPTATPTPTPTPEPTPTPSPTVTIDPNATPTPYPTGGVGAFAVVKAYEDALIAGAYDQAWALLAKGSRPWGTLDKFKTDRAKYIETVGTEYSEELSPPNTLTIPQWIEGRNWNSINPDKAFLVSIHWSSVKDQYAGWEIWIVNPTKTGWELYQAH